MAAYFLDSSALVKRYAAETGSAWVENLTDPRSGNRIYVAAITHVEVIAAIARKKKGLLLSATDAAAAIGRFENDLQTDLRVFDLTPNVITHGGKTGRETRIARVRRRTIGRGTRDQCSQNGETANGFDADLIRRRIEHCCPK